MRPVPTGNTPHVDKTLPFCVPSRIRMTSERSAYHLSQLRAGAVDRNAKPVQHDRLPMRRVYPLKKPPGMKESKKKIVFTPGEKAATHDNQENLPPQQPTAPRAASRPRASSAARTRQQIGSTQQQADAGASGLGTEKRRPTSAPKARVGATAAASRRALPTKGAGSRASATPTSVKVSNKQRPVVARPAVEAHPNEDALATRPAGEIAPELVVTAGDGQVAGGGFFGGTSWTKCFEASVS